MTGVPQGVAFKCGEFTVTPFYLPHTTRDKDTGKLIPCPNFGYLVQQSALGTLLYATDMEYIPYSFKDWQINHLAIECNYCSELADLAQEHHTHRLKGHCALSTCLNAIKANMTAHLRTVTLLHLSDTCADEQKILREVKQLVGSSVEVNISKAGLEISLSRYPF